MSYSDSIARLEKLRQKILDKSKSKGVHEDDEEKDALDDCISQKVPKIFDERPDLDPGNEADRNQAVAIAADFCRERMKE